MGQSLMFLHSYTHAECALQDTAGKQKKNLQVICSGHLAIDQDELVAQEPPTLTIYVMTGCCPNDLRMILRNVHANYIKS